MSRPKFRYKVPEHQDEIITARNGSRTSDPEDDAAHAAHDYYYYQDGWEAEWPLIFEMYDDEDNILGRYEVYCELQPIFRPHPPND